MSNTKTGLMFSELSNRVYWGTINTKTNVARSGKKDVTSDFIGIMLQKFPVGFSQDISVNGKTEATVIMLEEKPAHKYKAANEMYEILQSIENDSNQIPPFLWDKIQAVLAKARGEHV
jgi:hypothetical protein